MIQNIISGVGLNLRLEMIDAILEQKPQLSCLEIIVENWLSLGPHHKKLEKLRSDYPISFHCVGMNLAGEDPLNIAHIDKIKELAMVYEPIHISDHLCMSASLGVQHHDLLPIPYNEKILKNTIARVGLIQDRLQQEILVENLSYYIQFQSSIMGEFSFIDKLVKASGCYILLDLNNLWVNSKNLNISFENELKKVNWSRVREMHLAGPEIQDGIYVDTHGSAVDKNLLLLVTKYKEKLKSMPIIYERDNNLTNLKHLLEDINEIREVL